ncbi:MAG: phospholipase D-like domain-containing protein [Bacteroidetes bacterium]|nr:phospholipase D-like domain-containing protein [Bacteroidota bacterium]
MAKINPADFQVLGTNTKSLFSLKLHRGDGMLLIAMNWKKGKPSNDFVGFAIEYKEPGGDKFYALKNRVSFLDEKGKPSKISRPTTLAPIQKFRWVHFPRNAELKGLFTYRVTPVFMNTMDELSYGEPQTASITLQRETYPNQLNVTFTRGFVSSQAFVDKYEKAGGISKLLPKKGKLGLDFTPTHPKADEALTWMGFEGRSAILELLDLAIADKTAKVKVVAYDLNQPEIVTRLEKLKTRLSIIIDDSGEHAPKDAAETLAAARLLASTNGKVKRHHMSQLQHNKTIVVDGTKVKAAVCGSTNFTWRGLYVQSNNAVIVRGAKAIKPFLEAFDNYWKFDGVKNFGPTTSAGWNDLGLTGINAKVTFSPHSANNAMLDVIAKDLLDNSKSSIFYSLAFLSQTTGSIRNNITKLTKKNAIFIYGITDKETGGFDLLKPDGNVAPVFPSVLKKNLPEPFKSEPTGGGGTRMHHKFVVIDFDKPTARVYLGSYNFSPTADTKNGENLLLIQDRKIAVSYMIEAIRIFDHYHFRVAQNEAKKAKKVLSLVKPPRKSTEKPWWSEYYTNKRKIKDREVFA